jgi:hypothetical protein
MKLPVLAAIIVSVVVAVPAEAATKKHKRATQTGNYSRSQAAPNSHDVYVGNELVGRDPDPFIRSQMMRNPHPWDGPD